jgi:hypothetical protein
MKMSARVHHQFAAQSTFESISGRRPEPMPEYLRQMRTRSRHLIDPTYMTAQQMSYAWVVLFHDGDSPPGV